jgi:hypothetical protein
MKHALLLALPLLLCGTPALATGGITCQQEDGEGPSLSLVIGHVVAGGIVGASLTENGVTRSTLGEGPPVRIAQSWIDDERLWVDLVDSQALRREAQLRARFGDKGEATGTLVRGGRTYKVRCAES